MFSFYSLKKGLGQQFFSPPTLSVDPRQWNIPIDTPVCKFDITYGL